MWDVVVFGLAFAVWFLFGAWKSYKSGEFTKFIDHIKLASSVNDDLFDGETKTFVVSTNGSERTVGVRTKKDAMNKLLIPSTIVSKLYFGPQRDSGLHLEYILSMEGKGDFLRLTEKEGEKIINTSEFNLSKTGAVPALEMIVSLVLRMGATPANWWDTVDTES
ncbi:hypothetical protein OAC38_01810 [Candidatus Poseidoniaceae archaeon]|nr:hypothetical protein [Candidatus Poseidoniaceae archaeon]